MKAVAVFPGKRAVDIIDHPEPKIAGPTEVKVRDMVLNNQVVVGTVNAPPQAFEAAISHLGVFMDRWPDAVTKLITARFPINRALDTLSSHAGGIKNVVQIAS